MVVSLQEYYGNHPPNDPFGSPRPGTGRTHRGSDRSWTGMSIIEIPSWVKGEVVMCEFYGEIGNTMAIRRADGLVAGFCHLLHLGHPVGSQVGLGQGIGANAGSTGSVSTGTHLHATASWTSNNPGEGSVVDPEPLIRQALASVAGGGEIPFPEEPGRQGDDMSVIVNYGGAYYLFDTGFVKQVNSFQELGFLQARGIPMIGDADRNQAADDFVYSIISSGLASYTREEIEALQEGGGGKFLYAKELLAEAGGGGGSTDLSGVNKKLDTLTTKVDAIPAAVIVEQKKAGN
jgi:hypothetical protein